MKIETKCLHEGYKPENGGPGVMPIVQSTTYRFDSTAKIASLFDMPTECIYSRFANPTCDAVEKKIASLEGGVGAMLTSSGQAASLLSIKGYTRKEQQKFPTPNCGFFFSFTEVDSFEGFKNPRESDEYDFNLGSIK